MRHQKHQISLDEFYDYVITYNLAGAYGRGENKSFNVYVHLGKDKNTRVFFEVVDHKEVKINTEDFEEAVEVYNSL